MSVAVLSMSISLEGFIAGPNQGPDNPLGDGGHRLHEWAMADGDVDLEAIRRSGGVNGKVVDEFMSIGAIVAAAPADSGGSRSGVRYLGMGVVVAEKTRRVIALAS